jgi:P-type Ca2+ transporter type 2A
MDTEEVCLLSVEDTLKRLDTSKDLGLSVEEVSKRLTEHGKNELPEQPSTPLFYLILQQFDEKLVKILLAAAAISFILAFSEKEEDRFTAFVEPFVILLILIANAVVGVWQEASAEKAIEALKEYSVENAHVIRNGSTRIVSATELVPGDIVSVSDGDRVPADGRLIELSSTTLRVDQSILTGESDAKTKIFEAVKGDFDHVDLIARKNIMFSGTEVTYGKGKIVVVATGTTTEIGRIHERVSETETEKSPMKKKLDEFGDLLANVITVICILVWIVNVGHFNDEAHGGWIRGAIYYFKIAIALAVAAIPEGLPAVVTTCLALGTRRMAKKNAIVRTLPSVETLGCTTVIASDKTGTLTTNMMSAAKVLTMGVTSKDSFVETDVVDTQFDPRRGHISHDFSGTSDSIFELSRISTLCNESRLVFHSESGSFERAGDAMEVALRVLTEKIGCPSDEDAAGDIHVAGKEHQSCGNHWETRYSKVATLEFTRERKSMSVLCERAGPTPGASTHSKDRSHQVLFVKGAPEGILDRCDTVMLSNGKVIPLTDGIRGKLKQRIEEYGTGELTLRCLGMAIKRSMTAEDMKKLDIPEKFAEVESNMTFVGVVGLLDPPRPEVKGAIAKCHRAGIRVIVVTGDLKATAESICRRVGVFGPDEDVTGKSYTGKEFEALSYDERLEAAKRAKLFSRTEPAHKELLVKCLQELGEVCAMTGDGVNDSPALRKADIGIAMGSGTAVAKGAADMVLADDNFSTIEKAVEEGRSIYNNTKQFIRYLISSNIGEVACILFTALLGIPEALVPVQLLWVNLVTDGLPATALGFNPSESNIMEKKPRNMREPVVDRWLFTRYLIVGLYVGFATIASFIWWFMWYESGPHVTYEDLRKWATCEGDVCAIFHDSRPSTVALSVMVSVEMFNALNAVSEDESLLKMPPWKNMWLVGAVVLSFVLHFIILYVPFLAMVFGVAPLNAAEWLAVISFSFPVILIDEVLKFVSRAMSASSAKQPKDKGV